MQNFKAIHPLAFGKFSFMLAKTLAERLYKVEDRIKNINKGICDQCNYIVCQSSNLVFSSAMLLLPGKESSRRPSLSKITVRGI